MFEFIRIFFAFLIILFVVLQTRNPNKLLRDLHETEIFSYQEAKWFIRFMTWFSSFSFLIMTFLASLR
jgi:preprotein translocase subunit SecG